MARIKPGERRLVAPHIRKQHGFPAEVVIGEYLGIGAYGVRGEGLGELAALNEDMLLRDTPEAPERPIGYAAVRRVLGPVLAERAELAGDPGYEAARQYHASLRWAER